MVRIGKNYHVIHNTGDLIALETWYDQVFSISTHLWHGNNYSAMDVRNAELALIGDLCIEPLAPAFQFPGWEDSAMGRFHQRFGERWHSLAWAVPEGLPELYLRLKAQNVRLYGHGRDIDEAHIEDLHSFFTHPKDTYTQLQFDFGPRKDDPRFQPGWDPSWVADKHPLGAVNSSHVTLKVDDLNRAKRIYVDTIGGKLLHEGEQPLLQTKSAFVQVGEDTIVELAQPANKTSMIGQDMDKYGMGLYAVTLKVKDLDKTEKHLTSKGVRTALKDKQTLVCDPTTTHNAVWAFTTWNIPNDKRKPWSRQ